MDKHQKTRGIRNYAWAFLIVAAAALSRSFLGHFFGITAPFVTFYPAVMLVVLLWRMGPGLFATALSGFAATYLFGGHIGITAMLITLAIFCFSGVLLIILAHRLKKATACLVERAGEERFRLLVTASSEVLYRMSPDWSEMRQLHGGGFISDTEGPNPNWLQEYIHPDDQPHVMMVINEAIRTKGIFELEHRVLRVDGSIGWTFSRAIPVLDASREIVEWFGAASDITERKRAEEGLRKAKDELELRVHERTEELRRANEELRKEIGERERAEEQLRQAQKMEAVGTMAGGIAHDFNNMLAVILGNSELALDELNGNDGPKRNIEQIVKASKRARDLVKQILAFSRKTETARNPVKLTPLVKETFKLLRGILPSTIKMDLSVETEMDTVVADPSQIQQILMNLATNAAHAMSEKGGTLTIGLADATVTEENKPDSEMQPGAYTKLTVRDTGIGIKKEVLHRIFEPFFTTKEAGQGTGMGLAVVYGIVKSHGGTVTADSRPGNGSTFNVFLPCVESQPNEQREEQGDVPHGKERILLVDDEQSVVETVSNTLRRLGYRVTTALSASEAWSIFQKDHDSFDLVITDQTMPDLTGIDLAQRMLRARKDLPIILFTGYSEAATPEKAKSAGISEFVMKPVAKREVAETIRRVLDARSKNS